MSVFGSVGDTDNMMVIPVWLIYILTYAYYIQVNVRDMVRDVCIYL